MTHVNHRARLLAVLVAAAGLLLSAVAPVDSQTTDKPSQNAVDLADIVDLARYVPKTVRAEKDPKTGFVVAGVNDTALLRTLIEINGQKIADLERDMRPGAKSDVGSSKGFLGKDEKLLDVLAMDNKYVVEELGLTHQELARHLHAMGAIGMWQDKSKRVEEPFVYRGRHFKVKVETSRGIQLSPFRDDTKTNHYARLVNLDTGKKLSYSLLLPHMIERYGFYEGKGTPYRLEPGEVVAIFDFLKVKKR